MSTKDQAIAPCPFCGAGETLIKENGKMWTGMKFSEPASVSIQHWCAPVDGQPNRMVERVGRDMGSAISAWNSRAEHGAACATHQDGIKQGGQHDYKWPEPIWLGDIYGYSTEQLKQAVRDFGEQCAQACAAEAEGRGDEDAFVAKLCADAIRALIKEIEA